MSSHENESYWHWTNGLYASLPPKELARVLPLALANLSAISRDSLAVIQPIASIGLRSPGAYPSASLAMALVGAIPLHESFPKEKPAEWRAGR